MWAKPEKWKMQKFRNLLFLNGADDPIRTGDPLITSETLWPAELHRLVVGRGIKFTHFLTESQLNPFSHHKITALKKMNFGSSPI